MSIPLTINGAVFEYPVNFDENWGVDATGWAQAVTNGMLQMAGGSFPLTADINFGPNFGLLSKYFETRSSNPATIGTVRLSSADAGIAWRNNANSANLVLTTDTSDNLRYNGSTISGGVNAGTQFKLGYYATTSSNISPNPNTTAATQVLVTDANGVPTTTGNGGTTATEIGYVSGVTSAIQTQLNARVTSVSGTANQITSTGGTTPVLSLPQQITLSGSDPKVILNNTSTGDSPYIEGGLSADGFLHCSGGSARGVKLDFNSGATTVLTATNPANGGVSFNGCNDGSSAAAGNVGEYVESVVTNVTAAATGQYQDTTTISLTPGDWDVTMSVAANSSGVASITEILGGISKGTAGNAFSDSVLGSNSFDNTLSGTSPQLNVVIPVLRLSLTVTTTVRMKMRYQFTGTTPTSSGRLSARRIR